MKCKDNPVTVGDIAVERVETRKVSKGFDPPKEHRVDVSMCSEEDKEKVQQAFFDAGVTWEYHGKTYQYLDAVQYSNTYQYCKAGTSYLMHSNAIHGCNITAQEFLDLVYEPENQDHAHTEYRHKSKTHTVNGVEIPDLRIEPKTGQGYWYPNASIVVLVWGSIYGYEQSTDRHRLESNLCYEPTEAGRQAAILHAKAWLGI